MDERTLASALPSSIAPAGRVGRAAPAAPPAAGAAFQALLEDLEARASALSRASADEALDQGRLQGVVRDARESLEGALSLGEALLEAYRAAATRPSGSPSSVSPISSEDPR